MRTSMSLALMLGIFMSAAPSLAGDQITLAVMASEDADREAARYEVLRSYLKVGNPSLDGIRIEVAKDYPHAVELFRSGKVDGMFAGSFVAATLIAKRLAVPVVRPLLMNGFSTYRALVIARRRTKPFTGIGDFAGKRVAYTLLASSGEVYVRSLLPPGTQPGSLFTPVPAASHLRAVQAVERGEADYAVIKDLVFNRVAFPDLEVVGMDPSANPNMTLILTPGAMKRFGKELRASLLYLEGDETIEAGDVRKEFLCSKFIPTTEDDFRHTYDLMKKAGIDPKTFDWRF